jgi:hypothetical protein
VLARLAYLAVTNAFAAVRLPPMSIREEDAEILLLRQRARAKFRRTAPFSRVAGSTARLFCAGCGC